MKYLMFNLVYCNRVIFLSMDDLPIRDTTLGEFGTDESYGGIAHDLYAAGGSNVYGGCVYGGSHDYHTSHGDEQLDSIMRGGNMEDLLDGDDDNFQVGGDEDGEIDGINFETRSTHDHKNAHRSHEGGGDYRAAHDDSDYDSDSSIFVKRGELEELLGTMPDAPESSGGNESEDEHDDASHDPRDTHDDDTSHNYDASRGDLKTEHFSGDKVMSGGAGEEYLLDMPIEDSFTDFSFGGDDREVSEPKLEPDPTLDPITAPNLVPISSGPESALSDALATTDSASSTDSSSQADDQTAMDTLEPTEGPLKDALAPEPIPDDLSVTTEEEYGLSSTGEDIFSGETFGQPMDMRVDDDFSSSLGMDLSNAASSVETTQLSNTTETSLTTPSELVEPPEAASGGSRKSNISHVVPLELDMMPEKPIIIAGGDKTSSSSDNEQSGGSRKSHKEKRGPHKSRKEKRGSHKSHKSHKETRNSQSSHKSKKHHTRDESTNDGDSSHKSSKDRSSKSKHADMTQKLMESFVKKISI